MALQDVAGSFGQLQLPELDRVAGIDMQELLRDEASHGVVREASDKDTTRFCLRGVSNRGIRYSHDQRRELS